MIRQVSVIGAGTMGRGIAFACALNNLSVVVQDIHKHGLMNAKQYMEEQFQKSIQKGKITEEQVKKLRGNIHYSLNIKETVKICESRYRSCIGNNGFKDRDI